MKIKRYEVENLPFSKLALISDLHNKNPKKIITILEKEKPEAILLAGDIFNGNKDFEKQENSIEFLKACVDIAPTYYVKGNHENDCHIINVPVEGIHFISRNWEEVKPGVFIGGHGEIREEQDWFKDYQKIEGYKILLTHYPVVYDEFNLVLCGHSHGGQWRIGKRGVYVPRYGIFPKLAYGRVGNTIITSGCSNTAIVPRYGNPKEVVIITPKKQ